MLNGRAARSFRSSPTARKKGTQKHKRKTYLRLGKEGTRTVIKGKKKRENFFSRVVGENE